MRLIQTGNFKENGKELFYRTGLIDLDVMEDKIFQTDIVPKSYNIIMHDYEDYNYYVTNATRNNDGLILFCNKNNVRNEVKFIYENKEYFSRLKNDFWWDVSNNWMLFPNDKMIAFEKSIDYDHQNWWMQRPEIEREHAYQMSLKRKN